MSGKRVENLDLSELGVYLWNKQKQNSFLLSVIPTGSYFLNKALGIGGWPEGKVIEIFGSDSSGKSTLAFHAVAEAQKLGKTAVYIDLENTFNPKWAETIGVDMGKLFVSKPETGEKTFEVIKKLIEHGVDLIVVDSVAALVPSFEFEGNMEDQTMGLHARLMSKGLRIIQSNLINHKTTIIFINQIRDKISNSFIPVTTTTGGRALRYCSSIRVEVKRCESIKNTENEVIGFVTKLIVIKNKFGVPLIPVNTALYFENGFDHVYEIMNEALNKKILVKKSTWFEYSGKNVAQGIYQLRKKLIADKELFSLIEKEVIKN